MNTFSSTNASGFGQRIELLQEVEISCKVLDRTIQSASPDGYWYRIASAPWNDQFYGVANNFGNGDDYVAGPGNWTKSTNWNIPDC